MVLYYIILLYYFITILYYNFSAKGKLLFMIYAYFKMLFH